MFYIYISVKSNGGLEPLVELIKNKDNHDNKELMAAVTGTETNIFNSYLEQKIFSSGCLY